MEHQAGKRGAAPKAGPWKKRKTADNEAVTINSNDDLIQLHLADVLSDIRLSGVQASDVGVTVAALSKLVGAATSCQVTAEDLPDGLKLHNAGAYLAWHAPAATELVGSFALGVAVGGDLLSGSEPVVDVAIQMPAACFQARDHLDHKYTDKRSLYLAHVLCLMSSHKMFKKAKTDCSFCGDQSKQGILVCPRIKKSRCAFKLRVLMCIGLDGLTSRSKLLPSRNNNRRAGLSEQDLASEPTSLHKSNPRGRHDVTQHCRAT
jgi:U3 small nucleolar RNA-associated protein 22